MERPKSSKTDAPSEGRDPTHERTFSDFVAEKRYYDEVKRYWSAVPIAARSMICGRGCIDDLDLKSSTEFLRELKDLKRDTCVDCGAGIGRVTKSVLMPLFVSVDIVEQDRRLATYAYNNCVFYVYDNSGLPKAIRKMYLSALQEFVPHVNSYNLAWCQWVLRYLRDEGVFRFLSRIRGGLTKGGYLVIKETVSSTNKTEKDPTDSSYLKPLEHYKNMLGTAGYKIEKIVQVNDLPKSLNPVYMIACRLKDDNLGATVNK